jgi:hypothetical protein
MGPVVAIVDGNGTDRALKRFPDHVPFRHNDRIANRAIAP